MSDPPEATSDRGQDSAPSRWDGRRTAGPGAFEWTVVATAFLLAMVWGLGDSSLHRDEFVTAFLSRCTWGELWIATMVEYRDYFPLHHAVCKVFGAVAGESSLALRLPGALATVGFLLVLYGIVRARFGAAAALLASFLLLANPAFLSLLREARSYGLALFTSILAIQATYRAATGPRQRPAWLAGVWWTLALYAHPIALFELASVGFAIVLHGALLGAKERVALAAQAGRALLTMALLGTPAWIALARFAVAPQGIHETAIVSDEERSVILLWSRDWVHGRAFARFVGLGSSIAGFALIALFAGIGFVRGFARDRLAVLVAASLIVVPWVAFGFVAFGHGFSTRYLIYQVPAFAFLVSAAFPAHHASQAASFARPAALGGLLLLLSIASGGAGGSVGRTDWDRLASDLRERAPSGASVLISGTRSRELDTEYLENWHVRVLFDASEPYRFGPVADDPIGGEHGPERLVGLVMHTPGSRSTCCRAERSFWAWSTESTPFATGWPRCCSRRAVSKPPGGLRPCASRSPT